ncbi:MAG: MFS transporter [Propionibacteriaceae bacterium]|nr:MFS transporter [Propionibacteriaceae bacterium]
MLQLKRLLLPAGSLTPECRWIVGIEAVLAGAKFSVPFLTLYLAQCLGLSFAMAGLLVAIRGCGGLMAGFVCGAAADFLGEKKVLGVLVVGQIACAAAIPHLLEFPELVAGFFLLGFFINGTAPVFASLLVRSMPITGWTQAYSAEYWAVNVGFAVTAICGGWVAAVDYAMLFYLEAGLSCGALLLAMVKLPTSNKPRRQRANRKPTPCGILRRAGHVLDRVLIAAQDKLAVALISASFLFALCLSQMTSTLPLDMELQGYSPDQYGYVIFWNGALLSLVQISAGKVIADMRKMRLLVSAAVISGAGYALLSFTVTPLWFVLICVTIWTAGEMVDAPVRSTVVSSLAKSGSRGRYLGLLTAALTAGYCFGPLLGGWLLESFGRIALWLCTGLLAGVAAGIRFAVARRIERRLAT